MSTLYGLTPASAKSMKRYGMQAIFLALLIVAVWVLAIVGDTNRLVDLVLLVPGVFSAYGACSWWLGRQEERGRSARFLSSDQLKALDLWAALDLSEVAREVAQKSAQEKIDGIENDTKIAEAQASLGEAKKRLQAIEAPTARAERNESSDERKLRLAAEYKKNCGLALQAFFEGRPDAQLTEPEKELKRLVINHYDDLIRTLYQ